MRELHSKRATDKGKTLFVLSHVDSDAINQMRNPDAEANGNSMEVVWIDCA